MATVQTTCYRLAREEGGRILWFDEAGHVAYGSEWIERDQTEDGALELELESFRRETVTFPHGEHLLAGDLSLPAGSPPYPAVVFVHGSGPASRHDYDFGSGRAARDEILRRGFATFIWSKPGIDESTGDYLEQSMEQRAGEVLAAMARLAERADIDGDRIGLLGGSQAGWVMPMVPAHRSVAFVIAIACPSQTGLEQTLYLADNELIRIGIPDEQRADARERVRALLDTMRVGVDFEEFLRGREAWLAEVKQRPWYPPVETHLDDLVLLNFLLSTIDRREFGFVSTAFSNDAPPRVESLHMPVLAIYGSNDTVVDWRLGVKAYEEIPRIVGNPDVTVRLFEGADHGMMVPDSEGYNELAPGYLATLGEWLAEHR